MKINHNISAIIANNQLHNSETRMSTSVERLSSGLKINRAADDPAGLAISQKMRTQIRGLDRATTNAQDGISVIETAEGALTEVHSMLQRMRELAVQGATGSYSNEDRVAIQKEVDSLVTEIDRIAEDTQFNTTRLLNGSLDLRGYTNSDKVDVITFSDTVPEGKYLIMIDGPAKAAEITGDAPQAITAATAGKVTINGESVELKAGDTAQQAYEKLRNLGESIGIEIGDSQSNGFGYRTSGTGSSQGIAISCSNAALESMLSLSAKSAYGEDAQVRTGTGFNTTATVSAEGEKVTITDLNGFEVRLDVDKSSTGGLVTLDITDIGSMTLQIGANEGETMDVKIPPTTAYALGLDHLNYLSQSSAGQALTTIDSAISMISGTRSSLGAYQNRLEHAVASLNVSSENMTTALSRIEDVDMAEEMSEYTASSVLQQAGVSVLAQANDIPQTILQLLQ